MEYHSSRFQDYSLLIYKQNQLIAILPANISNKNVYSHQGLTYGGLVFNTAKNKNEITLIYGALIDFLKSKNITYLTIKTLPSFYNIQSSLIANELKSFNNSSIIKQNTILAIDYRSNYSIHKTKLKRFKKLETNGFVIKEGQQEFNQFWNGILVNRLAEKHQSKPVHSLPEIEYLHKRFPQEILQYNIYNDDVVLAGITLFKKGHVVKSQYGMASLNGEKLNALDMLFVYLIKKYESEGMHFFSMGSVNNNSKLGYSKGMLKQKQELGCSTYKQDIIKLNLND